MNDNRRPSLFERQMAMYTSYHRDHRNRASHFVGIPAITVSLMVVLALARFSIGGVESVVRERYPQYALTNPEPE